MRSEIIVAAFCAAMLSGCSSVTSRPPVADLQRQVADTERAFAKTMADRDHAAFASFLSEETIFFAGAKALRGKKQVADMSIRHKTFVHTGHKKQGRWIPSQFQPAFEVEAFIPALGLDGGIL